MSKKCNVCGNELTPQQQKDSIKAESKVFWHESVKLSAKMIPYNDAFYEITEGKYKGNLIHTSNVIK